MNHSNFSLEMKKAENHTSCKVRVADNGNERLHVKTAAFGFQEGGGSTELPCGYVIAANQKGFKSYF